jgi:fibro-slime domain-containing protein
MKYSWLLLLSLVIAFIPVSAANPPTIYVKVIYYDFRADGSNPEFEMYEPATGRTCAGEDRIAPLDVNDVDGDGDLKIDDIMFDDGRKSLVLSNTLEYETHNAEYFGMSSIAKPVGNPSVINSSVFLKYWFRDWSSSSGAKGKDFTKPTYNKCRLISGGIVNVGHDRSFENIVIKDSIRFNLDHDDFYSFVKNGACDVPGDPPEFYPLDGKGFGDEGKQDRCGNLHNFCFTTEMHVVFQHKAGLSFTFKGDDNVWMFIDGKLEMDVNGIDWSGITLDFNTLGLTAEKSYKLDYFHVERHTDRSKFNIVTNVVTMTTANISRKLR